MQILQTIITLLFSAIMAGATYWYAKTTSQLLKNTDRQNTVMRMYQLLYEIENEYENIENQYLQIGSTLSSSVQHGCDALSALLPQDVDEEQLKTVLKSKQLIKFSYIILRMSLLIDKLKVFDFDDIEVKDISTKARYFYNQRIKIFADIIISHSSVLDKIEIANYVKLSNNMESMKNISID